MNPKIAVPVGLAVAIAAVIIGVVALAGGRDPARAQQLHREAMALEKEGKSDEAVARMKQAVAYDPQSIGINRDYQRLMRRAGKIEEIRAEYRKRAANFPASADAQYLAARLEEGEALEKGMKLALELNAAHAWANQALGAYYEGLKRTDDAVLHFERAARSKSAEPDHARTYIAYLYSNQRYDDIDRLLTAWEKLPPDFARSELEIDIALGLRPDGSALQLQAALHREAPYLYAIRIVRADKAFRQISVRRGDRAFVVHWTRMWVQPSQTSEDAEAWQRPERPPFAELHSAAMSRLMAEENR